MWWSKAHTYNLVSHYEGIKNQCQLLHASSENMLVSNIREYGFITKRRTKGNMVLLLDGERVHFFLSNPEIKPTKEKKRKSPVYIQALKSFMLAKTEGGPAGCHSSLISQHSIPIQIARPPHQRAIALGRRRALLTTVAPPQCGPRC